MDIAPADLSHVEILKTWFPDETPVRWWGGPRFRFPFTHESFLEDMHRALEFRDADYPPDQEPFEGFSSWCGAQKAGRNRRVVRREG